MYIYIVKVKIGLCTLKGCLIISIFKKKLNVIFVLASKVLSFQNLIHLFKHWHNVFSFVVGLTPC